MASRKFKSNCVADMKSLLASTALEQPILKWEAHSERPAFQYGPLTGPSESQDISTEGDLGQQSNP